MVKTERTSHSEPTFVTSVHLFALLSLLPTTVLSPVLYLTIPTQTPSCFSNVFPNFSSSVMVRLGS